MNTINLFILSLLSLIVSIDTRSTTRRSTTVQKTKSVTCDSFTFIDDATSTCTSSSCNGGDNGTPTTSTAGDNSSSSTTATSTSTSTSEVISGQATYYTEWSSSLGSCGLSVSESPVSSGSIVALPQKYMNDNCNQCVQVNYNGKSIIVTATDTCPGCGDTGIDLSQDGFTELAGSTDAGRIDVTWQFVPCS